MRKYGVFFIVVVVLVLAGLARMGLEARVRDGLAEGLGSAVSLEGFDMDLAGRFELAGLEARSEGADEPWLSLERLTVEGPAWRLLRQDWRAARLEAEGVELRPGQWRPAPGTDDSSPRSPVLPGICVVRDVEILWPEAGDGTGAAVRADSVVLTLQEAAGHRAAVRGLAVEAGGRGMDSLRLDARVALVPGGIALEAVRLVGGGIETTGAALLASHSEIDLEIKGPAAVWAALAGGEAGAGIVRGRVQARYDGAWDGRAGLAAEGIEVSGVRLDSAAAALRYGATGWQLDSLGLRAGEGRLSGRGRLAAAGGAWAFEADWRGIETTALPGRLGATVDGTIRAQGLGADPEALRAEAEADIVGRGLGARLQVAEGRLRAELKGKGLDLYAEGAWRADGRHTLAGQGTVDHWAALGLPQVSGGATLRFASEGAWDRPQLRCRIESEEIFWSRVRLGRLSGAIEIDSSGVFRTRMENGRGLLLEARGRDGHLESGRLSLAESRLDRYLDGGEGWSGRIGLDVTAQGTIERPLLKGRAWVRRLRLGRHVLGDGEWNLALDGRRLDFDLEMLDSRALLDGRLDLGGEMPFALRGRLRRADLGGFVRWFGRGDYGYEGEVSGRLEAEGALARPAGASLRLDIEDLWLEGAAGRLQAVAPARVRFENEVLHVEALRLAGSMGRIAATGRLDRRGRLDMGVDLEEVQLALAGPLLGWDGALEGNLGGSIRLGGDAAAPIASGRLQAAGLRWGHRPLGDAALDFSYSGRRLRLDSLALDLPRGRLEAQGVWPLSLSPGAPDAVVPEFELRLRLRDAVFGPELGLPTGLEVAADADIELRGPAGDWQRARGRAAFERLRVRTPQAVLANPRPLVLAVADAALRIEDLELEVGFHQRPDAGGRATVSGYLGFEDSDLRFRLADLALAAFEGMVPGLEALEGRVDVDVGLQGPLAGLRPSGYARMRQGRCRIGGLGTELFFRTGEATIRPGRIDLGGFEGQGRRGSWTLAGSIGLVGVKPDTLDLRLQLQQVNLTLADALNLRVEGLLQWTGPAAASRLQGRLRADGGRITRGLDINPLGQRPARPPGQASPRLETVELDVSLDLQKVQWRDALLDLELAGAVAMAGTAARPRIDGRIEATQGTFYYLDHRFEVGKAALMLVEPQPLAGIFSLLGSLPELDPHIEIEAQGDISALSGNEYRVRLELRGPLSDLTFDLQSDPPKSRTELLALLNFGDPDVLLVDDGGELLDRTAHLSAHYMLQAAERRFLQVLNLEQVRIDAGLFGPKGMGGTRVTLTKKIKPGTEVTYSTAVGHAAEGRVQLNQQLTDFLFFEVERDPLGQTGADLKLRLRFR